MSRGHGVTQRRILTLLAEHAEQHPPANDFIGVDPDRFRPRRGIELPSFKPMYELAEGESRAQVESARRAVKRLAEQGLVQLLDAPRRRTSDALDRPVEHLHLCARLVPDDEAQAAWDAEMRPRLERQQQAAALAYTYAKGG